MLIGDKPVKIPWCWDFGFGLFLQGVFKVKRLGDKND